MTTRKISPGSPPKAASNTRAQQGAGVFVKSAEHVKSGAAAPRKTAPHSAFQHSSDAKGLPSASSNVLFGDVTSGLFDAQYNAAEVHSRTKTDNNPDTRPAKRVLQAQTESPKLHKILAQSGLGSRLDMEALIEQGRVTVNGEVAHVGQRIQVGDQIKVNAHPVHWRVAAPPVRVIAYHKPVGEIVTTDDPQNRPTVFRKLPKLHTGKWQSVGRLDINTEGLLLFTNSGEFANKLMHPRFGLEREYAVRVLGALKKEEKERLLEGVTLEDGRAQFGSIEDGGGEGANCWYKVTIHEGRNREVRRLFESVGHAVSRLIRIRYGAMALPVGLQRGHWMELGDEDLQSLMGLVGHASALGPLKRARRTTPPKSGPRAKSPESARMKEERAAAKSRQVGSGIVNASKLSAKALKSAQNMDNLDNPEIIGKDSYSQIRKEARGRRRAAPSSGAFKVSNRSADTGLQRGGGRGEAQGRGPKKNRLR